MHPEVLQLIADKTLEQLYGLVEGGGIGRFGEYTRLWGWMTQYLVNAATYQETELAMVDDADAVVVLSGAPVELPGRGLIEASPENIARVRHGIGIVEEWLGSAALVLNGETEQLDAMSGIASEAGFSKGRQVRLDCGARGVANTATQFDVLGQLVGDRGWGRVVVVSSGYHVARVTLTAQKRFHSDCIVAGVPYDEDWGYDLAEKFAGEIRRILAYSAKGDIALPSELPELVTLC